jgi:hypothetical protein
MKKYIVFIIILFPLILLAQDAQKKFSAKFSGFVRSGIFFDSPQTIDAHEGHFLLYPQNEFPDLDGEDINAQSKFYVLSIQSRVKLFVTGLHNGSAKAFRRIER